MKLKAFVITLIGVFALVACSDRSPKLLPKPDYSKKAEKQDLGEYVPYNPEVDILFVIDNSASMDNHQRNLAKNIDFFIDGIVQNQLLDFHVGVLNSTIDGWGPGGGSLQGNPNVITRSTPNMKNDLRRNLIVGTSGSGTEVFLETIDMAIKPNMVSGRNAGFFRPGALLAIVFITDSDDQGDVAPQVLFNNLVQFKNGDPTMLTTYAVYIPSSDQSCERSGEPDPVKIPEFLQLTGGLEFDLCDPNYGTNLAKIGEDVLKKISREIPLKQVPVVNTIKVSYGSQVIPNDFTTGWVYNPVKNAIILGKDLELKPEPKGTQMQVYFVPADL